MSNTIPGTAVQPGEPVNITGNPVPGTDIVNPGSSFPVGFAPPDAGALQENGEKYLPGVGPDDLTPPVVKIIQKTTEGADGQPGLFWNTVRCEATASIKAVIGRIAAVRTYWGRPDISDEPPLCSSSKADDYLSDSGRSCRTCEHFCDTPWLLEAGDRRDQCMKSYNLLCLDIDNGFEPFILRAGGISAKAVRGFVTSCKIVGLNRPFYCEAVLGIKEEKKKAGTAFALTITPGRKFTFADLVTMKSFIDAYVSVNINVVEKDEATPAGEPGPAEETGDIPF